MNKLKNIVVCFILAFLLFACSKDEVKNEVADIVITGIPDIENPTTADKADNRLKMGTWGSQLLTATEFRFLHIEIGYVEGYKPEDEALVLLKSTLQARIHKPDGIEITLKPLPSSGKAPFDRTDWESIEDDHRKKYNTADKLALWLYFADGGGDDGTGSVSGSMGTAYKNTSIIIYDKMIKDKFGESSVSVSLVQADIMAHEIGHLFGLVDGGITPVSNHSNTLYSGHCSNTNCQMNYNTYSYKQTEMWEFCSDCIDDLRSIGGK